MKTSVLAAGLAAALALVASEVVASNHNWTQRNPGGKTVQGPSQGKPHENVNPGGNVPPGRN